MRNSILLDRGTEKMVAYPEKRTTDARGNSVVVADLDKPHVLKVNAVTGDQSDAKLDGQVAVKILRVSCRPIPGIGSNSLFWLRNEYWDLAVPPVMSGQTRALRHSELILRSRNEVRPDPALSGESVRS